MKNEQFIKDNKHVKTDEIKRDILDTQNEIIQMEKEMKFLSSTPMGMAETRLNHMKASARKSGIEDRKKFIRQLEVLLEDRNNTPKTQ